MEPRLTNGVIPRSLLSRYTASTSCCSERKTGCGSPQPPYRNMGDSDLSMTTEKAAIDSRASLGLSFDTPARLGRNALDTDRGTMSSMNGDCGQADVSEQDTLLRSEYRRVSLTRNCLVTITYPQGIRKSQ